VRNLADHGENWKYVQDQLATLNYYVTKEPLILNPTQFGIPQKRERVYILGIRKDICDTSKLADGQIEISHLGIDKHFKECGAKEAFTFIKPYTKEKELVPLEPEKAAILEAWSFFKDNFLQEPLHAPVWIPYFGVGYGPEKTEELYTKWGFYKKKPTPLWKQRIIKANREFYLSKQKDLDKWMECYGLTGKSKILNKFEWNCQKDCKSLKDGVIQIRQSGVRVKRPNYYPSLVAMDNTPIIWDEKHQYYRYLSVREAACLQSFNDDFKFAGTISEQHRELGNSVNVQILKYVAEGLFALQTNGGFKK
jgi:DNA (cytosine-5)-methyltransferase 1